MFLLVNWRLDLRSCVSLSFGQQHLSPQVKRGHNIVTDRWAGACSPHPHPRPQHTHSNTDNHNCYIKNARFDTIQPRSSWTDGLTDQQTNGQSLLYSCMSATKKSENRQFSIHAPAHLFAYCLFAYLP